MAEPARFYSHHEKALRVTVTAATDGRLRGTTDVALADLEDPTQQANAKAHYELFGPGDVVRLAPGAITRRFPAPFASNAEATKLALIEFAATDLPWRYTPHLSEAGSLLPWIVLIVGQRAPDDLVLRTDGRITIGVAAQLRHPLAQSARWAHVHQVEGHAVSRIVAPPLTYEDASGIEQFGFLPNTEYFACLVPAFKADGTKTWDGNAPVTCELYDSWTFRTGPEGDFRDLARKLHKAALEPVPGGKPFGRAEVSYTNRASPPAATLLQTAGALRLPQLPGDPPDPADNSPENALVAELTSLTRRLVTPDGRAVITAPRYDAPFSDANTETPTPGGWAAQLRGDPRVRGAAGLGAWNVIEWQDRIADAAAVKAGDLLIASDRVRHVALGIEASRSLWRRRLPADPAERIAFLMPVLNRLLTTSGESALATIAGRTPQLSRALLSSAARRAFRPGPARTALANEGRTSFGKMIRAANECPGDDDPAAIRFTGRDPQSGIKRAIHDAAGGDADLADRILGHLGPHPDPAALAAALAALSPGPDGLPDPERVRRFLSGRTGREIDRSLVEWHGWMKEHAVRERCRPVDIDGLANIIAGTIDPTVPRPPAVERVLATLPGITHIGPVEIEPDLDLPLWSFLSQRAPDWMLPGAGDLLDGDVVVLATNPTFVEALLVGANHQATAELRWRNLPLTSRWSPLRKFWQRPNGEMDIEPIRQWPVGDALGSPSLVPPDRSVETVIAFRTSLFRRYPATVVYLYQQENNWMRPDPNVPLDPAKRRDPSFTGTIGPDLTFFGFKVSPQDMTKYWVVLEEPPAGYRFYHQPGAVPGGDHSAGFARQHFAVPVRVLLGKLLNDPA